MNTTTTETKIKKGHLYFHASLARVERIRAKAAADWHDATPDEMTVPSTIGEERATPIPAPRMKAAMAIDFPRKPVAQSSMVVYMLWNSVPVPPANAGPAHVNKRAAAIRDAWENRAGRS